MGRIRGIVREMGGICGHGSRIVGIGYGCASLRLITGLMTGSTGMVAWYVHRLSHNTTQHGTHMLQHNTTHRIVPRPMCYVPRQYSPHYRADSQLVRHRGVDD